MSPLPTTTVRLAEQEWVYTLVNAERLTDQFDGEKFTPSAVHVAVHRGATDDSRIVDVWAHEGDCSGSDVDSSTSAAEWTDDPDPGETPRLADAPAWVRGIVAMTIPPTWPTP